MTTVTRDEFDVVKELLMSAARYAESANERIDRVAIQQELNTLAIDRLVERQEQTQLHLDRLGDRVDALTVAQDQTQLQLNQLVTAQDQTQQQLDQSAATQREIQRVLIQTAERQSRNDAAIESLAASVARLTQLADRTLGAIEEMQSEVRGLQTENRRIWEILQRQGDG